MLICNASRVRILRVCLSDTGKFPEILVGYSIEFTSRRGDSWITTEVEVVPARRGFYFVP